LLRQSGQAEIEVMPLGFLPIICAAIYFGILETMWSL
jgi:hypothetical protein